ncbi:hypothetical protein DUI87_23362 [Hirundo rustica rustica]|uniref:Uncharacterized protein n=1 Tax=Hirundo rustica rustica TaxID=333673 RepID=A0A3M0JLN5_HIRRU|nr:hypothetical protein DUI87_23362 [Hirundo rustica rustica]
MRGSTEQTRFADHWKQLQYRQHMGMSDSFFSPFALNHLSSRICAEDVFTSKPELGSGMYKCHEKGSSVQRIQELLKDGLEMKVESLWKRETREMSSMKED